MNPATIAFVLVWVVVIPPGVGYLIGLRRGYARGRADYREEWKP